MISLLPSGRGPGSEDDKHDWPSDYECKSLEPPMPSMS